MDETLDDWFVREILAHEAALMRYLMRRWAVTSEVPDLRQEVYVRVYEAAATSRPTSPKSFLFTTARHLMTDKLRRNRVVSIEAVADLDALKVLIDELTPERRLSARQDLMRLAQVFDRLPEKCRDVVWLRKVEELPQKVVAARLGVTEGTVEKHVAKGMRILAAALFGEQGIETRTAGVSARAEEGDAEQVHGQPSDD